METAKTFGLSAIAQVALTVHDIPRAAAFYRDTLGVPFLFEGPGMAFFQAGSVRLYLGETPDERFRSRPVVYYAVDDLDAAYAEVTGRGAPSMARPHLVHRDGSTELWMAFVSDPDGTPVGMMVERRA